MFFPPFFGFMPGFPPMQTPAQNTGTASVPTWPVPTQPAPVPASASAPVPAPAPKPAPAPAPVPVPAPAPEKPTVPKASYADTSIPPKDLDILAGMYGDDIEHIYDLYPGQDWLFEDGALSDRARFLQFLIRVEMDLSPSDFRRNVDEVCARMDNLRTAYAYRNTSRPYRVVLKHRGVDITYASLDKLNAETSEADIAIILENIMEQDRLRGFNLEKDSLLRMVVYRTGEENVYAILVSQPHINTDGISMGMLIQNLFMNYALNTRGIETLKSQSDSLMYSEYLKNIDKQAELDYWKAQLGDYGPLPELPGHIQNINEYEDGRYTLTIPDNTHAALRKMQSKARVTLFNLLQTAWAVSLQKVMGRDDIVVGAAISGRDMGVAGSAGLSGGFTSMLPVRVKSEPGMTFGDLARRVQQDFSEGMKRSHCSLHEITRALDRQTPLFSHMLNMHNFDMPKVSLFNDREKNGIQLLSGTTYVSPSMDLCVLFNDRFKDQQVAVHFNYNAYAFSRETIGLLAHNLGQVLETVAAQGFDIALDDIQGIDPDLFKVSREASQYHKYKIASALRRTVLDAPYAQLLRVAERSQAHSYSYQEVVIQEDQPVKGLLVLLEGSVTLFMNDMEGWRTPFRVVRAGEIITVSGIAGRKPGFTGVVDSGHASIMTIPADALFDLIREQPSIIAALANELDQRLLNYARQWIYAG